MNYPVTPQSDSCRQQTRIPAPCLTCVTHGIPQRGLAWSAIIFLNNATSPASAQRGGHRLVVLVLVGRGGRLGLRLELGNLSPQCSGILEGAGQAGNEPGRSGGSRLRVAIDHRKWLRGGLDRHWLRCACGCQEGDCFRAPIDTVVVCSGAKVCYVGASDVGKRLRKQTQLQGRKYTPQRMHTPDFIAEMAATTPACLGFGGGRGGLAFTCTAACAAAATRAAFFF